MAKVFVIYETSKAEEADRIISMLRESKHEVRTHCQEHYPIADPLRYMLFRLLEGWLMGFVIITGLSFRSVWVLREIVAQNGLEERTCLYPVFSEDVEPPVWMIEQNEHWLRIGDLTAADLEAVIHRAEQ